MARMFRTHLRRRRMQLWLRREAYLLASEAERFDCPEMRREAERLIDMTSGCGGSWVLRTA